MKTLKQLTLAVIILIFIQCQQTPKSVLDFRWTEERAWQWHNENGWMVGTNFNPSTSINQLEFWQEDTYDQETAYLMRMLKVVGHPDVELMELDGYGHGIGYPSMPILLNKIKDITKRIK